MRSYSEILFIAPNLTKKKPNLTKNLNYKIESDMLFINVLCIEKSA